MSKRKKITEKISQNRLLFYLMILGLLPLIFVAYNYSTKKQNFLAAEKHIEHVKRLSLTKKKKQAINTSVRKIYLDADHYYIDNQLEKLSFLHKERKALKKIISSDSFPGDEKILDRYNFLKNHENRLVFRESGIEKGEGMEETLEILSHPVQVDVDDLKNILTRIEGEDLSLAPPQMQIIDFSLKRQTLPTDSEIFELDLKMIKREFTNEAK